MRYSFLVLALLASGCSPDLPTRPTAAQPTAGIPVKVQLSASPGIGAAAGSALVTAMVTDAYASAVPDASVEFTSASGSVESPIVTNDRGAAVTTVHAGAGAVLVTAHVGRIESQTMVAIQATPAPTPTPTPPGNGGNGPTLDPLTMTISAGPATVGSVTNASAVVRNAAGSLSLSWAFGDGATTASTSTTTAHTYGAAGTYTITATARDGAGRTASASTVATVSNVPAPAPPAAPTAPALTVTVGCVEGTRTTTPAFCNVTATNESGVVVTSIISDVRWEFGDGSPIQTGNVVRSHQYGSPGTFTVAVQVRGARGEVGSATTTVKIP